MARKMVAQKQATVLPERVMKTLSQQLERLLNLNDRSYPDAAPWETEWGTLRAVHNTLRR